MTAKEALLIPLVVVTCLAAAEVGLHRVEKLRPLPRTYVGEHTSRPNDNLLADPVIGWRYHPSLTFGHNGRYRSNSGVLEATGFFPVVWTGKDNRAHR